MPITATIPLTTPFGPATFTVTVNSFGEVVFVESSASQLPEMVFKLTYGDRWEEARAYFLDLKENLPFQVEAALVLPVPPPPFMALRASFNGIAMSDNDFPQPMPDFRQRALYWKTVPGYLDLLFLVPDRLTRSLQQMSNDLQQTKARTVRRLAFLEPWMFSLLDLLHSDHQKRVYQMMGALRTPTVREYLFSELERPGRHIAAEGLLLGVMHYRDEAETARIAALYPSLRDQTDLVITYLKVLEQLRGKNICELALTILADHPFQAAEVLKVLTKNNFPNPVAAIRQQFDRAKDGGELDSLLGVINAAAAEGKGISLAEMNARVDTPAFLANNPIEWPQQLPQNWTELAVRSAWDNVLAVVKTYLNRPEAFLQRNALLQLRILSNHHPEVRRNSGLTVPEVEDRLRELIDHRVDKIYTVAIDLAGEMMLHLQHPELMVDALLAHGPTSRYRLMDSAALKQAAQRPDLRQRQIDYMRRAIAAADSPEELELLDRFIPYVRFLEVSDELKAAVADRQRLLQSA